MPASEGPRRCAICRGWGNEDEGPVRKHGPSNSPGVWAHDECFGSEWDAYGPEPPQDFSEFDSIAEYVDGLSDG